MEIEIGNGLFVKLNRENLTASVTKATKTQENVTIPRIIKYESQEYKIIRINNNAFQGNCKLLSLQLPDDSYITSIGPNAFDSTPIQELTIPANIETLEEGWCNGINHLTKINLSSNNPHMDYIDNQYLIQKGDEKTLLFVNRDIKTAVLPSCVTRISESAFSQCWNLTSLKFKTENGAPSNLREIGKNAFFNDMHLKNVDPLPKTLKNFGESAFASCISLTSLQFEDHSELEHIGKYVFNGSLIQNLTIPPKLTHLEDGWCKGTTELVSITVSAENHNFCFKDDTFLLSKSSPDGEFDTIVFSRRDVESLVVPSEIKRIGCYAFGCCQSLTSIDWGSQSHLEIIGTFAFNTCLSLNTLGPIPATVKRIEDKAFSYCPLISEFTFAENSQLEYLAPYPFLGTPLETLEIPANLSHLEESWCMEACELKTINISPNNKHLSLVDEKYVVQDNELLIFAIREIQSAVIPSNIKRIGKYAFKNCHELKTVKFAPNSQIEEIGKKAFFLCDKLETVDAVPPTLKLIGKSAFRECIKLLRMTYGNDCKTEPNMPNLVEICSNAFNTCSNLEMALDFSVNVKSIGHSAFASCKKATSIRFASTTESQKPALVEIGHNAFSSCINIETCTPIPSSVRIIGEGAFSNCPKLKTLAFENNGSLKSIDKNAFYGCTSLELTTPIPSSLKYIGRSAFENCQKLTSFEIKEDSKLQTIGKKVFSNTLISKLHLPTELTTLEDGWSGNAICLKELTVSPDNKTLLFLNNQILIVKNGAGKGRDVISFAKRDIESVVLPQNIIRIAPYAFCSCVKLSKVEFANQMELQEIGDYAFFSCSLLNSFPLLPTTVYRIGDFAFGSCCTLKSFEFPETSSALEIIGHDAFHSCAELIQISPIPASVKRIGFNCFGTDMKLKSIQINSLEIYICKNAFIHCMLLKEAKFPNAKKITLEQDVFQDVAASFLLGTPTGAEIIKI